MANKRLMEALVWARESVGDRKSVKGMAEAVGIPRTTYDSYEKGKAEPPEDILVKIGVVRGLPPKWWKNYELQSVDARISSRRRDGIESVPLVPVPCMGFITKGSLRDQNMYATNEPVELPANMVRPEYKTAFADANDTGLTFPHGSVLLLDPTKLPTIGQKAAVELRDGTSSIREMAWETDHVVYRSFNNKPDLLDHEVTVTALLVGSIAFNKPGRFNADYFEDGI